MDTILELIEKTAFCPNVHTVFLTWSAFVFGTPKKQLQVRFTVSGFLWFLYDQKSDFCGFFDSKQTDSHGVQLYLGEFFGHSGNIA